MRRALVVLTTACLIAVTVVQYAKADSPSQAVQVDVRQFMTASEFKAAGLEKLSAEELRSLNQWLGSFAVRILQATQGGAGGCGDVIESQIEGRFQRLERGNCVQAGERADMATVLLRLHVSLLLPPQVTIFPAGGGCKMKVEGVSDSISVKRLK